MNGQGSPMMISLNLPATREVWIAGLGLVVLYSACSALKRQAKSKLPLPPGPKKLPIVGNIFDLPSTHTWEAYMAWSKEFNSDIIHLDLAGQSVIVLSSVEATGDLLAKRSSIYSDRARLPMIAELMGWDFLVTSMKYSEEWRIQRRLFNHGFAAQASIRYRPKQLTATHELLQGLLLKPDAFMDHFRQWASEIIMSIAYGIDILPEDDPYIALAREAARTLSDAGVPGKYLVDSFPILKYVPSWLPGAQFKRDAERWRKLAQRMVDVPLAETKRQMEEGSAPPSFTADSLNALKDSSAEQYYTETAVRAAAGTMYVGGADTTVSSLATFLLAMLANPEAQRKAQEEIDLVTGGSLPDYENEATMPYVSGLVMEVLRWKNVGPIAFPHFVGVEDEYKGYRIPENSLVIGNTWAILHDDKTYPDPYAFKPERFLMLDGEGNLKLDPSAPIPEAAFGFGRRICPGRHMATSSLWISIACILATFNVTKALDEHGREIEPSYEFDSGFINSPLPFKCSIRPRSEQAGALIQAAAECL